MIDLSLVSYVCSAVMIVYALMWVFFAVASLFYKHPRTSNSEDERLLVSAFLPACNEERVVGELIKDLLNQSYKNIEVIVVPHNCTDRTAEVASSFSDPRVKVHPLKGESGKAVPLNHALRYAKGEIVLELDSDNRLYDKDYIKKAVRYFQPPVCADALQSKLKTKNEEVNILTRLQCLEYLAFSHIYWGGRNAVGLSCSLGGTGVLFRRDLIEKVGGWDNELTEDYDVFCKLQQAKAKIIHASDVVVWDEKPATWSAIFRQRSRWIKGHMVVMAKRFRQSMHLADFLYLIAPFYNVAWYLAHLLVAAYILTNGQVTYWYPPVYLWIVTGFALYSCMATILIRGGDSHYIWYLPAYYVFAFHWLPVFLFAFNVKTWGETKTEHIFKGAVA